MAMTGGRSVLVHTGYGDGKSNFPIRVYVYYKTTSNVASNSTTISCGMYVTTPTPRHNIGNWGDFYGSYVGTPELTFHGEIDNFTGTKWIAENKTFTKQHNANGTGSATIYWKWGVNSPWGRVQNISGSFNITLPPIPTYTLTTKADEYSTLSVHRNSSQHGSTGVLSNNSRLYVGDVLSINFEATPPHTLAKHTLNGASISSGHTHTVNGNVNIEVAHREAPGYKLTINESANTSIAVQRLSSAYGGTGTLKHGSTLYKGDSIKVNAAGSVNHIVSKLTYNGAEIDITGGAPLTVNGNVVIQSYEKVSTNYKLTVIENEGVSVSVQRISSPVGHIGVLQNGAPLYNGDVYKITSTLSTGFTGGGIDANNKTLVSGQTMSNEGNLSVSASAVPVPHNIVSGDGVIGDSITIKTSGGPISYPRTIRWSMRSLSGTIATKTTDSSTHFMIPTTLYPLMANAPSGTLRLYVDTFKTDGTLIGTKSKDILIRVPEYSNVPTVSLLVEDINPNTLAITGDSSVVIRGQSDVKVSVSASGKNNATIREIFVNGEFINGTSTIIKKSVDSMYSVRVVDSRGFSAHAQESLRLIPYIPLTLNAQVKRESTTSDQVNVVLDGQEYRGALAYSSAGALTENLNTTNFTYSYRVYNPNSTGGDYAWKDGGVIPQTGFTREQGMYSSPVINLPTPFDYNNVYEISITAQDGLPGKTITSVTKVFRIGKGIPLFDWGKSGINFNVPVKFSGKSIEDSVVEYAPTFILGEDGYWYENGVKTDRRLVDQISVGARNLIQGTATPTELSVIDSTPEAPRQKKAIYTPPFENGGTYTLSFKIQDASPNMMDLDVLVHNPTTNHTLLIDRITTMQRRYSWTFGPIESDAEGYQIELSVVDNTDRDDTLNIVELQLEEGTVASSWNQAPEDLDQVYRETLEALSSQEQSILDILSNDSLTEYEIRTIENLAEEIQVETNMYVAMLEDSPPDAQALSARSKDLTDAISNMLSDSTYGGINFDLFRQAFVNYKEALSQAQQKVEEMRLNKYAELDAGLQVLGEKLGSYEAQLKLTPGKISMNLDTGSGLEEAMSLTRNKLAFNNEGKEVAYFSDQMMYISDATVVNSLSIGNHRAEKQGKDLTVFRWIGG